MGSKGMHQAVELRCSHMAEASSMNEACVSLESLKPLKSLGFPTQDLRRFARSPASVFNPGASLADTFRAERRTGVVFPDEARASFVYFDGQARSSWLRSEASSAWRGGVLVDDVSGYLQIQHGCIGHPFRFPTRTYSYFSHTHTCFNA